MNEPLRDDRVLTETRWVAVVIVLSLASAFVLLYRCPGSGRRAHAEGSAVGSPNGRRARGRIGRTHVRGPRARYAILALGAHATHRPRCRRMGRSAWRSLAGTRPRSAVERNSHTPRD